ncbi:phasin family protein [Sphingomonas sinipercae]|uniref:Phasin family protein n=1 Tax=Sphingomonas sinipercae TaxID=2714944 RepID=A0A6G7ZLR7_9SPHN|nr:phasin family protein [Sphingomonas sinipercae]QIL01921.1 phasin family protein [Sphingomonas sinipercae]
MVAETETAVENAAKAGEAQVKAVAETTKAAAKAGATQAKKAQRKTRRAASTTKSSTRASARKASRKTTQRTARTVRNERNDDVNFQSNNAFAGFNAFPMVNGFEELFSDAAGRTENVATRSRKAVEDLTEITRGNVEAIVEAGRIATAGAQSISQRVIAKNRDSLDRASETVRSLTSARTPADLLQAQAEFLRGSFDRFVAESSELTESMVKLAGEAIQPISNRATVNAERLNELVA